MDVYERCVGPNKLCQQMVRKSHCFTSKRCANFNPLINGGGLKQAQGKEYSRRFKDDVTSNGSPCPGKTLHWGRTKKIGTGATRLGDHLHVLAQKLREMAKGDSGYEYLHIEEYEIAHGIYEKFLQPKNCTAIHPATPISAPYFAIMQRYIVPALDARFVLDPRARTDELIIHLRSGDMRPFACKGECAFLPNNYVEQALIPCSFYGVAIRRFKVNHIRVITESDMQHPCLAGIRDQNPHATVQSSSREADAAAIIHASNFIPSASWFSYSMINLNSEVQKIVYFRSNSDGAWSGRWLYPCRRGISIERATGDATLDFAPPNKTRDGREQAQLDWLLSPHAIRFQAPLCRQPIAPKP